MEKEQLKHKTKKTNQRQPDQPDGTAHHLANDTGVNALQQKIGNRAVQRLIAQRSSDSPTRIDEEVSQRIDQARNGGEALHADIQNQMGQGLKADFSQVRIHTSQESHELNQALGAKAFTTGKDIFFKQGAYDPHSSSGKELIAHELTHVVQQSTGQVPHTSNGMTVNAPGDAFEKQADQVAQTLANSNSNTAMGKGDTTQLKQEIEPGKENVQRQEEEEEEQVQLQEEDEEEEEIQAKRA